MNTSDYLAQLGVSLDQARSFVMANLGNPGTIYNVAKQFKIDSQILADIVAPQFPGVTASQVEAFFSQHGHDGTRLNANHIHDSTSSLMEESTLELPHLYGFNHHTGILSTPSLRDAIVAQVGMTSYTQAFDPIYLPGAADGVFSTNDLGFAQLGNIPATWQNVESLFFGTFINMLTSISQNEGTEVANFVDANAHLLDLENRDILAQLEQHIVNMFADTVPDDEMPFFSNAQVAEAAIDTVVQAIQWMGNHGNTSLFDDMLGF